ncbi:MAG: helix-turn-helix transcriptional regulator [Clostridia bacterium]|nr:helix-turn-helix transcriptional regulator [Clostridia bacterium]
MRFQDLPARYAFSAMGNGRSDYDGFYGMEDRMNYFGFHCHDFYEIYIHFQGGKFYAIGNEMFQLEPNMLIIMPPFHMHGLQSKGELLHYERAFLYLSQEYLATLGCGHLDMIQLINERIRDNRFVFPMDPAAAKACGQLIRELQSRPQPGTSWDRFVDFSLILSVLRIVIEATSSAVDPIQTTIVNPTMHQVLVYINAHYTEPLTLQGLAAQFNMSVSTLSHEFIEYTRHSVYNYILYRRISLAKQKLYEDSPIGEISFQCGFGDYSNFLRAFHKVTGTSPRAYRQVIQENKRD